MPGPGAAATAGSLRPPLETSFCACNTWLSPGNPSMCPKPPLLLESGQGVRQIGHEQDWASHEWEDMGEQRSPSKCFPACICHGGARLCLFPNTVRANTSYRFLQALPRFRTRFSSKYIYIRVGKGRAVRVKEFCKYTPSVINYQRPAGYSG